MSRLATRYLGLELRTPLVASAGPYTREPESALRLQEAGAAAIVLPSLFEEQVVQEEVELSQALEQGAENFAEALSYFPDVDAVESTADRYLATIGRMKERLDVPVIASLNATSGGGWVRFAKLIERAGADALELNLYRIAADPARGGASMEEGDLDVVRQVREATSLPLAVKLSPYYSALANFAVAVIETGADGLVLFNRFYQPDVDADSREVVPRLELSKPWELRLPLRWIAILRPHLAGRASLAVIERRPQRRRCRESAAGGRRRRDDDVGGPAERPRAFRSGREGARGMDGRERVHQRSGAAGQRELRVQ